MGIRESIEKYKTWISGTAVVALLAAAVMAWRGTTPPAPAVAAAAQAYYSVDDGATFFTAAADLIPPFDCQGKPASRAVVFSCDSGKTRFVGYLERYPEAAKKELDALKSGAAKGPPTRAIAGVQIKKPGTSDAWVSRNSPAAAEVLKVKCQGGGTGEPEIVMP